MLRSNRSLWDLLQALPAFKTSQKIFDQMDEVCQRGIDADEMPDGQGLFGYEPTNPIPTRTIFGSVAYLARLCDKAGGKVEYHRSGSISPDNIDYPVDVYLIKTIDAKFELFFSPYQKRNSAKAPKGLRLAEPPPQPPPYRKKRSRLYGWLSVGSSLRNVADSMVDHNPWILLDIPSQCIPAVQF